MRSRSISARMRAWPASRRGRPARGAGRPRSQPVRDRGAPVTSGVRACSARSAASSSAAWPRRKRIWFSRCPGRTSTENERGQISAIERPAIAGGDPVELGPAVGDHAGQQVQPPGRATSRWPPPAMPGGSARLSCSGDEVDAALLEHRAVAQVDLVHGELVQPVGDPAARAGQERGAHAAGAGAQPRSSEAGCTCASSRLSARIAPASISARISRSGRTPCAVTRAPDFVSDWSG